MTKTALSDNALSGADMPPIERARALVQWLLCEHGSAFTAADLAEKATQTILMAEATAVLRGARDVLMHLRTLPATASAAEAVALVESMLIPNERKN